MSNICLMFVYNLFLRVGAIYSKTKQKKCGIGNSKKKKWIYRNDLQLYVFCHDESDCGPYF